MDMMQNGIDQNELSVSQEELSLMYIRAQAARTCDNLMNKVSYYFTSAEMRSLAALFSRDADTRITMPWGIYRGSDAAERCFVKDYPDRDDPARVEELKGRLVVDNFCTPVIEVAGDGETARGAWVCPGVATFARNGKGEGYWSWKKAAADFRLEDGEWKIWHLAVYVCFNTPYAEDWGSSRKELFVPASVSADEPAPAQYYYAADAVLPDDEPEPPLPYGTWAEVAPGY